MIDATHDLKVYGASDDLIEVDGAVSEEWNASDYGEDRGDYVYISSGTVLQISYTDEGVWRISLVTKGKGDTIRIDSAPLEADDNYSDVAWVFVDDDYDPIRWVGVGNQVAFAKGAAA